MVFLRYLLSFGSLALAPMPERRPGANPPPNRNRSGKPEEERLRRETFGFSLFVNPKPAADGARGVRYVLPAGWSG